MNVFTYGSLTFDQVWSLVVRGSYRSQPARVSGFARFAVTGQTYPGVLRQAGAQLDGRLYVDVNAADLARLDRFEGADYDRIEAMATAIRVPGDGAAAEAGAGAGAGAGEAVPAQLYLFRFPERLSAAPWDINAFAREGIHRFLAEYCDGRVDPA